MAYLEEFQLQISNHDTTRFLQLWEEYCNGDTPDPKEFLEILRSIRDSDMSQILGRYVEAGLPLWQLLESEPESYEILSLILDIQTTNSPLLADTATRILHDRYHNHKHYSDKIRLVGLRNRRHFEGALRNFDLLTHLEKGKFVFHTGGWGTGEVMELSLVREELSVEFENLESRRSLTFQNAFKNLVALSDDHFLSRRFADPDALEEEARRDPVKVIKMLLRDCGPKTAAEIKDEMCVLVIPEDDWVKWWQSTRSKLKKDTMIETPRSIREPFRLRESELSHETRFKQQLNRVKNSTELLTVCYNFVRDLPDLLKDAELKKSLTERFSVLVEDQSLSTAERLQYALFCEHLLNHKTATTSAQLVQDLEDPRASLEEFSILALKKRALVAIHKHRDDWAELFVDLFFSVSQNPLRDYLLTEMSKDATGKEQLERAVEQLIRTPAKAPAVVVWYFQKALGSDRIPMADSHGRCRLFEAFMTAYHAIELNPDERDLVKKMYAIFSAKRYAAVRSILEHSSLREAKEFILLVSKCQTLGDHDKKIFSSLVEVVHPSLRSEQEDTSDDSVWTTEEGYNRTKEKLEHLSTVEIVENAREIEEARAHGDLRENAEYKAALERRSRLQGELKLLSQLLNRARVLTPDDIIEDQVCVGSVVEVRSKQSGQTSKYTILGPWDANPERNILSFQSRLAQALIGSHVGDLVEFNDDTYEIVGIDSFLEVSR